MLYQGLARSSSGLSVTTHRFIIGCAPLPCNVMGPVHPSARLARSPEVTFAPCGV